LCPLLSVSFTSLISCGTAFHEVRVHLFVGLAKLPRPRGEFGHVGDRWCGNSRKSFRGPRCLVAMEPPWSLDPDVQRCDGQNRRAEVVFVPSRLKISKSPSFAPSILAASCTVALCMAYRREVNDYYERMNKSLPPDSTTETLHGHAIVHRQLALGRRSVLHPHRASAFPSRASEVGPIYFKEIPPDPFSTAIPRCRWSRPCCRCECKPEEGLSLRLASKLPGPKLRIYPVKMEFNYSSSFGGTTPEAYEASVVGRLRRRCHALNALRDHVETAWKFVMPILDAWENSRTRLAA